MPKFAGRPADGQGVGINITGVSACLIVRDEAENLAACLGSLAPHVEEIVVVDTGSTDDSIAIAQAAGAVVVPFAWADSFAAARNAGLHACTRPWVLSIDADERAVKESAWGLSSLLAEVGDDITALTVQIVQQGGSNPRGHTRQRSTKLLRRGHCHWEGRVHERVVLTTGAFAGCEAPVLDLPEAALHLLHHGYADEQTALRKCMRNLRLAELELLDLRATDATAIDLSRALLDVGRTQLGLSRRRDGWANLTEARRLSAPGEAAWMWATDFLAWDCVRHRELDQLVTLVEELAAAGAPRDYLARLRACIIHFRGDTPAADALLASIATTVTVMGLPA